MIFHLDHRIYFPDPAKAEPDGLLAVGGDLSPERLKLAYQKGIFPWFNEDDPILWYSPHERCVIFPEQIKLSTSMKKFMRSGQLKVTKNKAFVQVIKN
ncbi:MAG: leucyl/phenylalanyl-tRNA--protein transferase, partial [Chitinophagaceae bacterium]